MNALFRTTQLYAFFLGAIQYQRCRTTHFGPEQATAYEKGRHAASRLSSDDPIRPFPRRYVVERNRDGRWITLGVVPGDNIEDVRDHFPAPYRVVPFEPDAERRMG